MSPSASKQPRKRHTQPISQLIKQNQTPSHTANARELEHKTGLKRTRALRRIANTSEGPALEISCLLEEDMPLTDEFWNFPRQCRWQRSRRRLVGQREGGAYDWLLDYQDFGIEDFWVVGIGSFW
ncbi:uncharacterized protein M6B38_261050 [Iris pallida]|uniref:Uncharacterized protein n=1 Tax=Iris pallida TaxID=29817 RepID=A0AAX6IED2_IRIPA|nr:uncharacterized protein M6B38_261050 [Iris pallida]